MREDGGVRILVAPDSFGDGLTPPRAAEAIAEGWRRHAPHDEVTTCPLTDGAAGFVDTLGVVLGGELATATVRSPLGDPVPAAVLLVDHDGVRTAYVEAAQACGPALVPADRRDPSRTSSEGVAELLQVAVDAGARRIVVGLGEAASHDAGAGMLWALGAAGDGPHRSIGTSAPDRSEQHPLRGGGGGLSAIRPEHLTGLPALRAGFADIEVVAAYDVDVPLLGLHGASATYAQARGATAEQAQDLERALSDFAHVAVHALGPAAARPDLLAGSRPGAVVQRFTGAPGSGAAGGLGFALALLGARLRPGARVVAEAVGLGARVADADLVLTGEDFFDGGSLHDGVAGVVAEVALAVGVPTVVVAGEVVIGRREWSAAGISGVYAVGERPEELATYRADRFGALRARAERVARTWSY